MKNTQEVLSRIGVICLVIWQCSCSPCELSSDALIKWVDDEKNGLVETREIGDFIYRLKFQPVDYTIAKELYNNKSRPVDIIQKRNELKSLEYYTLGLTTVGRKDILHFGNPEEDEYSMKLEYFNTMAEADIQLVVGSDTLPCALYQFEQTFGLSQYNNILLAFENTDSTFSSDRQIIFNDQVLGNGTVKFKIDNSKIRNTPTLKV
jgi:hypothetical protein